MMEYSNKKLMTGDCLKLIRVISSDIFQPKLIKYLIKMMIIGTIGAVIFQINFFLEMPNMDDFIKYAPSFMSTIYAILTYVEILLMTELIQKTPTSVELWAEDSCGEEVFMRIKKHTFYIKVYGITHAFIGIFNAVLFVYPREQDTNNFLLFKFFHDHLYSYRHILGVPCRFIMAIDLYTMITLGLHFVYLTQHLKFQILLLNNCLEEISKEYDVEDNYLIYNDNYQQIIQERLHFCIKRHLKLVQFYRLNVRKMGILIVLFSVVGCTFGIAIMILVLKGTLYYNFAQITMSCVTFFATVAAIFIGCQTLQDESNKICETILSAPWYHWNHSIRKDLLIFLLNSQKPMRCEFSDTFVIDYKLAMSILKTMYSTISVIINLTKKN